MGKVIAIANQKGGVGKTITISATASILSQNGYKILFVHTFPTRMPGVLPPGTHRHSDNMDIHLYDHLKIFAFHPHPDLRDSYTPRNPHHIHN